MANNLNELRNWFPSGTAEGELTILEKVFVYVDQFSDIMSPPPGNPHLLIGKKGSGKSAIISFAMKVLKQQNIPAVLLTPHDFDTSKMVDSSSTGDMSRTFYNTLMSAIARRLSEDSTGWFDGDRAALYYEAVSSGERSPDFLGRMGKFLAEIAKPIVKADFNAAFPHLTSQTKKELEKSIERSMNFKSFYLFIDDTDQVSSPDKPGHLNRIWALMLAVRRLCSTIPEIRAVISLRPEVWSRLQMDPSGQRDQTDHFKTLCVILKSDRPHVASIIDRRLVLASDALGIDGDPYKPFFKGEMARAPNSPDFRSWRDLIVIRSRERPRDAIQLVSSLARKAIADRSALIDEGTLHAVMPSFSEQISKQFGQEVTLECPRAGDILRTFSGVEYTYGGFTMSSEEAFSHFKSAFSKFSISLHGSPLKASVDNDVFAVWRFFYENGVINARISDPSQKEGYKHLDPEKDPTLVTKSRWNDLQATLWEINTVYRDYLILLEKEASYRGGLALKSRKRKGRNGSQ